MTTETAKKKRHRNFYVKQTTILLAEAMADQERLRLDEDEYGAGRIVDTAVLELARKRYSAEEIAAILNGEGV